MSEMGSWNLDKDVIAVPLIPNGRYKGAITGSSFQKEGSVLDLNVTLSDNGGFASDDKTPVDGQVVSYKVYLPLERHKAEMTGSGKQSKWQWRVNQIGKFVNAIEIPEINDDKDLERAVTEGEFLGIEVALEITVEEGTGNFAGQVFNRTNNISKA